MAGTGTWRYADLKTREEWHGNLLCVLEREIIEKEFKHLKQIIQTSSPMVPRNLLARSDDFFNLWELLERQSLLKVGKYDFLRGQFEMLKWLKLVDIIEYHIAKIGILQETQACQTIIKAVRPNNAIPVPDHQTVQAEPVMAEDSASIYQPVKPLIAGDLPLIYQRAQQASTASPDWPREHPVMATENPPDYQPVRAVDSAAIPPRQKPMAAEMQTIAKPKKVNSRIAFFEGLTPRSSEALPSVNKRPNPEITRFPTSERQTAKGVMAQVSAPSFPQGGELVNAKASIPTQQVAKSVMANASTLNQKSTIALMTEVSASDQHGAKPVKVEVTAPVQQTAKPEMVEVSGSVLQRRKAFMAAAATPSFPQGGEPVNAKASIPTQQVAKSVMANASTLDQKSTNALMTEVSASDQHGAKPVKVEVPSPAKQTAKSEMVEVSGSVLRGRKAFMTAASALSFPQGGEPVNAKASIPTQQAAKSVMANASTLDQKSTNALMTEVSAPVQHGAKSVKVEVPSPAKQTAKSEMVEVSGSVQQKKNAFMAAASTPLFQQGGEPVNAKASIPTQQAAKSVMANASTLDQKSTNALITEVSASDQHGAKPVKVEVTAPVQQTAKPEMVEVSGSVLQRRKAFMAAAATPSFPQGGEPVNAKASIPTQQAAKSVMANNTTLDQKSTNALMTEVSAPDQHGAQPVKVEVPSPAKQTAKPEMVEVSGSVLRGRKAFMAAAATSSFPQGGEPVNAKASIPTQQAAKSVMANTSTLDQKNTNTLMTEVSAPVQHGVKPVKVKVTAPVQQTSKLEMVEVSRSVQQRTKVFTTEEKGPKPVTSKSSPKERRRFQQRSQQINLVEELLHEVRIDGETYSLHAAPRPTTKLVTAFKDILTVTDHLDVPGRVTDLKKLIRSVKLVYCGIATCKVLTKKIEEVGLTVAKVCHRSAETATLLKNECVLAIETLILTHSFLVDGRENIAINNLKRLGQISQTMRDASNVLCRDLDHAKDIVFGKDNECASATGNRDDHAISTICAVGQLQIQRILVNEYQLWRLMCNFCDGPLAGDQNILKRVNNVKEKCIGLQWWGSDVFRRNIIEYKSMWVALKDICQVLENELKEAKKEAMMAINKLPTADEAKKMLPRLMKTLDSDLNARCVVLKGDT